MGQSESVQDHWFIRPEDAWLIRWYNEHYTPEELQNTGSVSSEIKRIQPLDLWTWPSEERNNQPLSLYPTAFASRVKRDDDLTREQILDDVAQEVTLAAIASMEQAIQSEEPLPDWVAEILSEAGWKQYHALTCRAVEDPVISPSPDEAVEDQMSEEVLLQALQERFLHVTRGKPCERCGCPLLRQIAEYPTCCLRCLPPRGYTAFSAQVDLFYPRRKKDFR